MTRDRGWAPAGDLKVGEAVMTLDGAATRVVWARTVASQADMYNLTVAQDHTFAVGSEQVVVHNMDPYSLIQSLANSPQINQLFSNALDHVYGAHSYSVYENFMQAAGGNRAAAAAAYFGVPGRENMPLRTFFPSGVDRSDMLRIGKNLPFESAVYEEGVSNAAKGEYVYSFADTFEGKDYQLALGVDESGPFVRSWYPTDGKGVHSFRNPNVCS